MADDAAGAVRRTPRPDKVPELWWSPTVGLLQKLDGFYRAYGGGTQRWLGTLLAEDFPVDAVPLAPVPAVARGEQAGAIKGGSVFDWVKQMVAEYADEVGSAPPPEIVAHITVAVLREMGWERRPVVLLRAEDCACPVGDDCPHGPEPAA